MDVDMETIEHTCKVCMNKESLTMSSLIQNIQNQQIIVRNWQH